MELAFLSTALQTLPKAFQILPANEVRIKHFNNHIVLIHHLHKPIVFDGKNWKVLEPDQWNKFPA